MALSFPHIDPVALSLGPLEVRWYALAYFAGFLIGWWYGIYLTRLSPHQRPDKNDIDDFIPWAVLGVILGGRIGYTCFYNFSYYAQNPLEVLQVWEGGMSFHGGVLGVITAILVFSYAKNISMLRLSDIFCTAAPFGIFFGRVSNFINGELYGRVTDMPWGVVFPYAGELPRHPSQLYEAVLEGLVLGILLFVLAHRNEVRSRPGVLTGVFLIVYGLSRIAVEFVREPDAHIGFVFASYSMGQILSVPLIILGSILISVAIRKKHESS